MMNISLDEQPGYSADERRPPSGCRGGTELRAELRQAMACAAAVWRDCGVEPGESVAVALADPAESLVACLGAAHAGAVAVVVDPASPPVEMERLRARGGWRFILAESREEQSAAVRDFVLTLAEWRHALAAGATPAESAATIAA